jgi:sulfopyruvate decarboxylase alpha subunit
MRMSASETGSTAASPSDWHNDIFAVLKAHQVRQVAYLPDAGLTPLIEAAHADDEMRAIVLTTEEEGVAVCAGAWLGGERSALLMQSSGVGNTINTLSLIVACKMPLVMLITMRGEFGEFNNWQIPMGQATPTVLEAMGMLVYRVDDGDDAADVVEAAMRIAYDSSVGVAVLLGQRLTGRKKFVED